MKREQTQVADAAAAAAGGCVSCKDCLQTLEEEGGIKNNRYTIYNGRTFSSSRFIHSFLSQTETDINSSFSSSVWTLSKRFLASPLGHCNNKNLWPFPLFAFLSFSSVFLYQVEPFLGLWLNKSLHLGNSHNYSKGEENRRGGGGEFCYNEIHPNIEEKEREREEEEEAEWSGGRSGKFVDLWLNFWSSFVVVKATDVGRERERNTNPN